MVRVARVGVIRYFQQRLFHSPEKQHSNDEMK